MSVITESHIQKFKSLHTNIDSFLKLSKEKQSLRNNFGETVSGKEGRMQEVNEKMINIIKNIKNHFETDDSDYFAAIFAWGKNKKERMMGDKKYPYKKIMNWDSNWIKGIHIEELKEYIPTIEEIEEEFELDKKIRMVKVKRLKAKYLPAGFDPKSIGQIFGGRRRTRGKLRAKSRAKSRKKRRRKRRKSRRKSRRRKNLKKRTKRRR